MKKIKLIVWAGLFLCATVFAEEQKLFSVTVEAAADPLFIRSFSGDYATENPALTARQDQPFLYQGEGSVKSFQSSGFADGIIGRTGFAYTGQIFGGSLQIRAKNDAGNGNVNWDWNLWVKLFSEHLRVSAGNTAQRGSIERYANFDGFLRAKIDGLGVMLPIWRLSGIPTKLLNNLNIKETFPYTSGSIQYNMGFADFGSTDTNDLFVPAGDNGRKPLGLLADVVYDPITVSVSVGALFGDVSLPFQSLLTSTSDDERLSDYDKKPSSTREVNAGIRIEGGQLADRITLAATYKLAASFFTKLESDRAGNPNLMDERRWNHAYGLYATITPFEDLGITVGYSGLYQTWENLKNYGSDFGLMSTAGQDYADHYLSQYKKTFMPLYHGINVHSSFSGIEKLTITFNNNVSFSRITGPANRDNYLEYANSWAYFDRLNEGGANDRTGRSESYVGVYNSLGLNYAINEAMTIMLQAANQLGFFTLTWDYDPATSVSDHLGVYAGMTYTFAGNNNFRAVVRGGLAMHMHSFGFQEPGVGTHKAGWIDYGIPLGLSVLF